MARYLLRTAGVVGLGGITSLSSLYLYTLQDELVPIPASDPIFRVPEKENWNPYGNPITQDFFVRRVPVKNLPSELQNNPSKLTEAFCAGVWSGAGFMVQRRLLESRARNASNSDHLWTREDFLRSEYQAGTLMADEFEVLEKHDDRIVIRGGDSPSCRGPRPMDAVLELSAVLKEDGKVVEFGFKSLFFAGDQRSSQPAMPGPVVWLHMLYAKWLLKDGVQHLIV